MTDITDITNITASQRILAHLHEGRLEQGKWHRERDGREFACMLGAISPTISAAIDCPASVMPAWLARLVVPLFDHQTEADALAWAGRFGAQMGRWHVLDEAAWFRVWESFCAACVADARRSAADADYAAAAAALWAARAAAAAARAAAAVVALDADAYPATAAAVVAAVVDRQTCWTRMATALCDLIDAELEAAK
jgi:hypothetical protein